ncbi:MAG: hypothetical protein AABZ10_05510 [Nitrospirota bacterium]
MLIRLFRVTVLLLLIVLVAGCVKLPDYRPDLPENLISGSGLVVGQVVGIGRLSQWSIYKDVLINDRKRSKVVNGFIAVPLSPGEYSFSSLYDETQSSSGTYIYRYMTTLPIKRKFTIRPGEVTNLGLLVLYPDPNDKEQKKFLRFFVDNTADMKHFLKTAYPLLAPKLRVDSMTLAPGDLIPANLLELLRKDIAMKEVAASGGYAAYVAGHVGTLAEPQRDKDGKISGVKLIEVPTVSNIQSDSPNYVKDRFAFLTTNNRLFFIQNGKVAEKRPPAGLRAGKVYALGSSDLVIVDDKFEIYTSYDNGDRWQPYLGSITEKKTSVKVSPGSTGYYAYMINPPRVVSGAYGKVDFRPVGLPQDMKDLGLLREKPAGLFAERDISFYMESEKRQFFFRPAGKAAWEARSMPAPNCEHIRFQDNDGLNLSTQCGDRAVWAGGPQQQYLSKDGGKTWQKK